MKLRCPRGRRQDHKVLRGLMLRELRGKFSQCRCGLRSDSAQLQREVLCDQVIVVKNDDDVDFKLDFEVGRLQRGAGEQSGEHHVNGDGEAVADVTFGDLDVLDLCGVSGVTFGTTTRLHSHQLELDTLDGNVRVLHHHLSGQGLADHTGGGV